MAAKYNLSVPNKRKLTTYGKSAKKKPTAQTDLSRLSSDSPSSNTTLESRATAPSRPTSPWAGVPNSNLAGAAHSPSKHLAKPTTRPERKRKLSETDDLAPQILSSSSDTSTLALESHQFDGPTGHHLQPRVTGDKRESAPKQAPATKTIRSMGSIVTDAEPSSPPQTPTPPSRSTQPPPNLHSGSQHSPSAFRAKTSLLASSGTKRELSSHKLPIHRSSNERAINTSSTIEQRNPGFSSRASSDDGSIKRPRRRLIDPLIENAVANGEKDEGLADTLSGSLDFAPVAAGGGENSTTVVRSVVTPSGPDESRLNSSKSTTTFARTTSRLKFTYGQSRSVIEEDNLLEALAVPDETPALSKSRRLDLSSGKLEHTYDVDNGDGDDPSSSPNKARIRDIHELRQSGASSRLADEMSDLTSQVGSPNIQPSSSRRSALLQIAQRIHDKAFRRAIRDHGVDSTVLRNVGDESDVISGYLIMTILINILAGTNSSHVARVLSDERAGGFLASMLRLDGDLKAVARDRKTNLSKRAQAALGEIQRETSKMPVWNGVSPLNSPQSLALKCLDLLLQQDINIGKDATIFSDEVTHQLFGLLTEVQGNETRDEALSPRSSDLFTALKVLELHSIKTMESQLDAGPWVLRYLPTVASAFGRSLQDPVENEVNYSILKLTLNMTNGIREAPGLFVDNGVVPTLAKSVCEAFTSALNTITRDSFPVGLIDRLILRLGLLINFAEQSSLVRQTVEECRIDDISPFKELIRLFQENHRRTAEADSVEKSHLNVAFGYLSVLLGYLCLHAPARNKFRASHSSRSLGPLLDSIREFITHHRQLEISNGSSAEDSRSRGSYVERLQWLVDQLEDLASYD